MRECSCGLAKAHKAFLLPERIPVLSVLSKHPENDEITRDDDKHHDYRHGTSESYPLNKRGCIKRKIDHIWEIKHIIAFPRKEIIRIE